MKREQRRLCALSPSVLGLVMLAAGALGLALLGSAPFETRAQSPAQPEPELNLKGAIDFHVHQGPDSVDRVIDADDLARKFDSSVCAVCIETIQGEGGVQPVQAEFLELARRLTAQSGALLLLDEIQCSLGRTGQHFAYQHYGVLPDVVTVAKPLAAGLPLGAILTTDRVAACMHPGLHGTTFGGGPLACAVAIEFLRAEERLLKHIAEMGEYFHAALQALDKKHISIQDVRGVGLMQALELDSPDLAKAVARKLLESGIIINRTHETVLRFLPPYIIQKKHVDQVVEALDLALSAQIEPVKSAGSNTTQKSSKSKSARPRREEAHAHA